MDRMVLRGYLVSINVRAVNGSITYDLLNTEEPSNAASLALFMYRKAMRINKLSTRISITRVEGLKPVNVSEEGNLIVVRVEP